MRYHELARGHVGRVLAEVLAMTIYFVIATIALVHFSARISPESVVSEDMQLPGTYAFTLGSIALAAPACLLAARWPGRRPGTLLSVDARFRWGLCWRAILVVLPIVAVGFFAMWCANPATPTVDSYTLPIVLITILLTPFQAAAEEILFRGVLPQFFGALRAPAWLAYALSLPFFVLAHGYSTTASLDLVVFAVCAAWLTYRSNGLEQAIVLHTINNVMFGCFGAFHLSDPNAMSAPLSTVVISSVMTVAATYAVTATNRS